jgi:hypothetical protein
MYLLCLLFVLCKAQDAVAQSGANSCRLSSETLSQLSEVWELARPELQRRTERGLAAGNPNELYMLAQYTGPLIDAARDCGLQNELDQLAQLYLLPFAELQPTTRGSEKFDAWLCSGPECPSWSEGSQPFEVILYSAQFLYAASKLVNAVSLVPAQDRTEAMNKLLKQAPVIASTYQRWLTSSGDPLYPRGVRDATIALIHKSHRTDDKQLQIAGGIVELLCAARNDAESIRLSAEERQLFQDYARIYWQLIESRARIDSKGRVRYDEAWGTIARAKCASHARNAPPTKGQCTGSASLSLDLGHFARVPMVIESYDRCGLAEGEPLLQGLAMQFADRVWNGDIKNPRFFNYFSGDGMYGWYNRTFDAKGKVKSKGWAPLALSNKGPLYFGLGRYSPRVRNIAAAYRKANRNSLRAHAGSKADRVLYLLEMLPSFVE